MIERIIPFEKYEGAGNDFVILDFFENQWIDLNDVALIEKICNRHFGVGADGLIAVCPSLDYDFEMKYLNSDGRFSSFCGNGSRCAASYMSKKTGKSCLSFIAADGPHTAECDKNMVKVSMKDIVQVQHKLGFFANTGSPHLVLEFDDLDTLDIKSLGSELRHRHSQDGTNVNFIHIHDSIIDIRTFERGVEDETLACGTGITAAAFYLASQLNSNGHYHIEVNARGGHCKVELDYREQMAVNVFLIGPAINVFSGFLRT
jgi:diaminopimelate epimerase